MRLVPLADRVILKPVPAEVTTASGIVLTNKTEETHLQAEVIAVGPGAVVDGKTVPMNVNVGEVVIYGRYTGTEVKVEGVTYIIVKQEDILAIIEK